MSAFEDSFAMADAAMFSELADSTPVTINGLPVRAIISPSGRDGTRIDSPGSLSIVRIQTISVSKQDLLTAAAGAPIVGLPVTIGLPPSMTRYYVSASSDNLGTILLYLDAAEGTGGQF